MVTKEEIIKRIEIMQAWVDGQVVEFSTADGWYTTTGNMTFDFIRSEYRIKPKPREVWIRDGGLFYSKEEAEKYGDSPTKYREVLDDEK